MRAMSADEFSDYERLRLVDLPNHWPRTEECWCE